jgi:hypothetical protein
MMEKFVLIFLDVCYPVKMDFVAAHLASSSAFERGEREGERTSRSQVATK